MSRKKSSLKFRQVPPKEENAEMVRRFRQWLTAQKYIPSTVEKYCGLCKGFCLFIGNKPMRQVIPLDVSDFITLDLRDKWADSVVNSRLAALRTFFDFLYMGGVVNTVPPDSSVPEG